MKKATPVLDMYYDFCENGIPNKNGLCEHFYPFSDVRGNSAWDEFELMIPINRHKESCPTYWGWDTCNPGDIGGVMTPLRQNIVLFIAAMRGEL